MVAASNRQECAVAAETDDLGFEAAGILLRSVLGGDLVRRDHHPCIWRGIGRVAVHSSVTKAEPDGMAQLQPRRGQHLDGEFAQIERRLDFRRISQGLARVPECAAKLLDFALRGQRVPKPLLGNGSFPINFGQGRGGAVALAHDLVGLTT